MLLSARFLADVSNVNSFHYTTSPKMAEGDAGSLYFQLVDAGRTCGDEDGEGPMFRYAPPASSTLTVTFGAIDDEKKVTRLASQPFPLDPSIWMVSILSTDGLKGTVPVSMVLNESGTIRNCTARMGLLLRVY
jgi:hypothetical protein